MTAFSAVSISRKLTVLIMSACTLVLLLACCAFITYDRYVFRQSKVEDTATLAKIIGSNSTAALTYQDFNSATEILNALGSKKQISEALIFDRKGNVFARYLRSTVDQIAVTFQLGDAYEFSHGHLALFKLIVLGGETIGTVYVRDDLSDWTERLKHYQEMLLIVGLGSLLASFLLASRLQKLISGPIVELANITRTVSVAKDYTIRAVRRSNDEVGELIDGFNTMLSEIQLRDQVLQEARKAAECANRSKSEFLANMSHEIRTPLNGIVGMTDLALDTQLTEDQREYLDTVKLSADTLLVVINDILDFSKIEAGKIELETIPFGLREWLEMTLKTIALRADEKNLELLCDVAPDVPNLVKGDSNRLRQVILNLLGNAVKFTNSGEVAVAVSVEPGTEDDEDYVLRFTTSDTGIGIPAAKRVLIFDAFSQADTSTTREYGGTGLGLSICKQLVEMMGGRIWVESEPGQGSKFHFTARLTPANAHDVPARKMLSTAALDGVRVLILDDNCTNLRILERMLNAWGMRPKSVGDGEEAIAELLTEAQRGDPYRLILTDMYMPGMDGFAFVTLTRQKPELTAVAIMMLTSRSHKGDLARCRELGLAACLLKPIRESELQQAVVQVLEAHLEANIASIVPGQLSEKRQDTPVSLRVLVGEDNAVNQRLAVWLLEKFGHRVVVAGNGREVLARLGAERFDLILMDIQMPEMDGVAATAAIREKERLTGEHLPIVALTANAMKGDREKYLACGMDDYLPKPIRAPDLKAILDLHTARPREAALSAAEPVSPL